MTLVDRATRCLLAFSVTFSPDWESLQSVVDRGKKALRYFSDGFPVYRDLIYPGKAKHEVAPGKSQTYSVEAHNAELRHYLARLARKSRCFSRCAKALHRAVWLFACAWNARQLHRKEFPDYCKTLGECLPAIN